ncbi:MAG: gamma-glutamyltransferase [Gemmatimonadetes bacterium]|nr:gamma-glutamyltransferase [Gemmatimonadota bacterium]
MRNLLVRPNVARGVALLAALSTACGTKGERAPEAAADELVSTTGVVVSAHHLASDAGAAMLAKGGNAVDAAVATAFALAVTHPSAGNIGGGGFMVIRLADGTATTIDYREKAPAKATATMYVDKKGRIAWAATDSGWRAPGVPGTVRGLAMAHGKFGKLPWAAVVMPAVQLAEQGFELSGPFANDLNEAVAKFLAPFPASVAAYGKPGGGKWAAGDTLRLPQLGRALRAISEGGPDAFYTGWIADSIDAQMRAHGGLIGRTDLAAYKAVEREPVRGSFNGYDLIAMGPPSSGGMVMMLTLNQLEALGIAGRKRGDAMTLHLRIEAARRTYLDRARWLGDPDFTEIPLARLLSKEYARELAAGIDTAHASSSAELGKDILTPAAESRQTTHFSVVDAEGNAVSNTYTIEGWYGSGVVVAGFLLNNEMGDFNKKPGFTDQGWAIGTPANVIAPGKRMLSSMSPVIVTQGGALRLVTGSPGGRTIPNSVLNVVLGVTAFGEGVRAAVDAPRIHHQWMPDTASFEAGAATPEVLTALRAMGHAIKEEPARSQGDAHSILYDAATHTARGANDKRSPDSGARAPKP